MILTAKTHESMVRERKKTFAKQNHDREKIGQHIKVSERQDSQERSEGE